MLIICIWFCAKSSYVFQKLSYSLCRLCLTLPQTLRLFYVSLRSQAPQQQYTVHCMHYDITLWAYLSEPLSHKRISCTEKTQYHVLKSLDHTLLLRVM